jgi:hypothetical protein
VLAQAVEDPPGVAGRAAKVGCGTGPERGPQRFVVNALPRHDAGRGGEGGIRTRDGLPRTAFPVRRHSPLGDLSRRRRVATPRRDAPGPVAPGRSLVRVANQATGGEDRGGRPRAFLGCLLREAYRGAAGRPDARVSPVAWYARRNGCRRRPQLGAKTGREWRRGRDSNPRCFRTPLFESGTINHSDTSPRQRIPKARGRGREAVRTASWPVSRRRRALRPRPGGCR